MLRGLSTDLQLWIYLGHGIWPPIPKIMLDNQTHKENILLSNESEWAEEDQVEEDEDYDDVYDYVYGMYGGYEFPSPYDSDELEAIIRYL